MVIMPFRVYNDSTRSIGHAGLKALGMDKRASSHNSFCNDARSFCPDVLSCLCFLLMLRSKQNFGLQIKQYLMITIKYCCLKPNNEMRMENHENVSKIIYSS